MKNWGRRGKSPKTLFFRGKRHDNRNLNVQIFVEILLSLRRLLFVLEQILGGESFYKSAGEIFLSGKRGAWIFRRRFGSLFGSFCAFLVPLSVVEFFVACPPLALLEVLGFVFFTCGGGSQSTVGGPEWTKMDLFGPKWTKMIHLVRSSFRQYRCHSPGTASKKNQI